MGGRAPAIHPAKKKGADGGYDGIRWFGVNEEFKAIVSVKGGTKIGVERIRLFDAVVKAQGAHVGAFLTLEKPTSPMLDSPVPRIQIVTIEEAMKLRHRAVRQPVRREKTFKRAAREVETGNQGNLDF